MTGEPGGAAADALHALCLADPVWAERYQGWTELGRGASATVVRTHSRASGEDVALKVFLRVPAEDWQRFQAEVRNAQALASPFIVRTYSPFQRGAMAWIEMEPVDGPDLERELERRAASGHPFTVAQAQEVGAAVARALMAGHEAGVVHRDVKPANVLLPRSGRPPAKLGDFGTSRLAGASRITHTGLLAGTPQYVAPEVVAGASAGPPSDVYGLMLCVYRMLGGGRFPFAVPEDAPVTQWLRAHADFEARAVRELNPDVPAWLDDLIARGLAKDPARRPSAAEVAAALEGGAPSVAARRAGRGPGALLAGGVALLVLLGVGVRLRGTSAPADVAPPTPTLAAGGDASPSASLPEGAARPGPPPVPSVGPRTAAALPAASPAPVGPESPAAAAEAVLHASLRAELLALVNPGPHRLEDLRIVVVDAAGDRHAAVVEAIAPGEELYVALDDFEPPLDAGAEPTRVEIVATGPAGARHALSVIVRWPGGGHP